MASQFGHTVVCAGWLGKSSIKGSFTLGSMWKERYCVLLSEGAGIDRRIVLNYFDKPWKSGDYHPPKGVIPMDGASLASGAPQRGTKGYHDCKEFIFEVATAQGVRYPLRAKSSKDRAVWEKAITAAIAGRDHADSDDSGDGLTLVATFTGSAFGASMRNDPDGSIVVCECSAPASRMGVEVGFVLVRVEADGLEKSVPLGTSVADIGRTLQSAGRPVVLTFRIPATHQAAALHRRRAPASGPSFQDLDQLQELDGSGGAEHTAPAAPPPSRWGKGSGRVDTLRDVAVIAFNDLELERKPFAQGGGGQIFRGTYLGQFAVAAKQVLVGVAKADFEREVALLTKLNHPNITLLHGVSYSADGELIMVMEFCGGGDLSGHYPTEAFRDTREFVRVCLELLSGVAYLHERGIAHRDLKPENVLLTEPPLRRVKLADFGLARKNRGSSVTRGIGTPAYMPPEMFDDSEDAGSADPLAVDAYALGVLLWELWFQRQPYAGRSPHQIIALVLRKQRPPLRPLDLEAQGVLCLRSPAQAPEALELLLDLCWSEAPSDRPSVAELQLAFAEDVATALASPAPRHKGPAATATSMATRAKASATAAPSLGYSLVEELDGAWGWGSAPEPAYRSGPASEGRVHDIDSVADSADFHGDAAPAGGMFI